MVPKRRGPNVALVVVACALQAACTPPEPSESHQRHAFVCEPVPSGYVPQFTAQRYCEMRALVSCEEQMNRCALRGSIAHCITRTTLVECGAQELQYRIDQGMSTLDLDRARACLSARVARRFGDLPAECGSGLAAEFVTGAAAIGEECFAQEDCLNGWCERSPQTCGGGVCRPFAAMGERCRVRSDCEPYAPGGSSSRPRSDCDPAAAWCKYTSSTEGICEPLVATGGPCNADVHCSAPKLELCSGGVCTPPKARGEACVRETVYTSADRCASGLVCAGTCEPAVELPLGSACRANVVCTDGYCSSPDGIQPGLCVPYPQPGEPCGPDDTCHPHDVCQFPERTCRLRKDVGEACSNRPDIDPGRALAAEPECKFGLVCGPGGVCSTVEQRSCGDESCLAQAGERCVADVDCRSGHYCNPTGPTTSGVARNRVCTPMVKPGQKCVTPTGSYAGRSCASHDCPFELCREACSP